MSEVQTLTSTIGSRRGLGLDIVPSQLPHQRRDFQAAEHADGHDPNYQQLLGPSVRILKQVTIREAGNAADPTNPEQMVVIPNLDLEGINSVLVLHGCEKIDQLPACLSNRFGLAASILGINIVRDEPHIKVEDPEDEAEIKLEEWPEAGQEIKVEAEEEPQRSQRSEGDAMGILEEEEGEFDWIMEQIQQRRSGEEDDGKLGIPKGINIC